MKYKRQFRPSTSRLIVGQPGKESIQGVDRHTIFKMKFIVLIAVRAAKIAEFRQLEYEEHGAIAG
jgi:hypothetical protein